MIKFSIITVCLNAGEDLIYTVNDVLDQTYDNYELIVKDGFSKDGSVEQLPIDTRIKFIQQKDIGIYDAMNHGIDKATGDYLIFMNAGDCFYEKETLEKLAQKIGKSHKALYYGHCYNESLNVYSNSPKQLTPFFCYRSMICHQAMVFDRTYLQRKKYDCDYVVSADREILLYTVMEAQVPTAYIPLVIAKYKGAGFCETEKNQKQIVDENQRLRTKYFTMEQNKLYRFVIALTLPKLRNKIAKNPKLVRGYKRIVGFVYGNKRGAEK